MHRILIAEDEPDIRFLLTKTLKDRYLCEAVEDGLAAIERITATPPDAVITDLKMPGATGLEVLAAARQRDPFMPVLVITGYATMHTAVEALRLGAYDYIQKPFEDMRTLQATLEHALEVATLRKENKRLGDELQRASTLHESLDPQQRQDLVRRLVEMGGGRFWQDENGAVSHFTWPQP